jgi:hypothetical protein
MAQTAAQKKALADAQALLKKQKARLASLEADQTILQSINTPDSALSNFREAEAAATIPTPVTTEQSDTALAAKAGPAPAGTFLGWDYQGNTQTTGTLRRAITADGKGGSKISTVTEKNPDFVSGSRGGGVTGGGVTGGGTLGGGDNPPADGAKFTATDGTVFTDKDTYNAYQKMLGEKETALDIKKREGQSAYDLLYLEFSRFVSE